jgi:hypothetical protein
VRHAIMLPTQWYHRAVQHPHVLTPREFYDVFIVHKSLRLHPDQDTLGLFSQLKIAEALSKMLL